MNLFHIVRNCRLEIGLSGVKLLELSNLARLPGMLAT